MPSTLLSEGQKTEPIATTINGDVTHSSNPETKTNGDALDLPSIVPLDEVTLKRPAPVYRSHVTQGYGQMGLFASETIPRHRYICEYRGQVSLKAAYKEDPKNYYDLLRTTRPHSLFHPDIDLCVDARRQGSEARFVRRSCSPNVILRSIHIPNSTDPLILLGLFSARELKPDEELTIGWEWEDSGLPPVAKMSSSEAEDYLERPEGRRMSKVWRQAFGGASCACPDTDCQVRKLFALLGVVEEETFNSKLDLTGTNIKRRASRPNKTINFNANGSPSGPVTVIDGSVQQRSGRHSRKGSNNNTIDTSAMSNGHNSSDGDGTSTERHRNNLGLNSNGRNSLKGRKVSDPRFHKHKSNATSSEAKGNGSDRKQKAASSGKRLLFGNAMPLKKLWLKRYLDKAAAEQREHRKQRTKRVESTSSVSGGHTIDESKSSTAAAKQLTPSIPEERSKSVAIDVLSSSTAQSPNRERSFPLPSRTSSPFAGSTVINTSESVAAAAATTATTAHSDRNLVKSMPTDADAPTPPPTDGVSLYDATIDESIKADEEQQSQQQQPSIVGDSIKTEEPKPGTKRALSPSKEEGEMSQQKQLSQATTTLPRGKKEEEKVPAAKKQRLSLQEYNKRRRNNTQPNPVIASVKEEDEEGGGDKPLPDLEAVATGTLTAQKEDIPPQTDKVPRGEKSAFTRTATTTADMSPAASMAVKAPVPVKSINTGLPPLPGASSAASSSAYAPSASGSRRDMPTPPPLYGSGNRGSQSPMRSSSQYGAPAHHQPPPPPMRSADSYGRYERDRNREQDRYRSRERGVRGSYGQYPLQRDRSAEREGGSVRRDRMRSHSRERGRGRQPYGGAGDSGYHYHHSYYGGGQYQQSTGSSDWRSSSSYGGGGPMQRMSPGPASGAPPGYYGGGPMQRMSPKPYQHNAGGGPPPPPRRPPPPPPPSHRYH